MRVVEYDYFDPKRAIAEIVRNILHFLGYISHLIRMQHNSSVRGEL